MSDGYSQTAKDFLGGLSKSLEKAVRTARPFKAKVHSPASPRLRLALAGDPESALQALAYPLRPGQPKSGDQIVAITLESGEVVVLGSVRDALNNEVSLLTSPLVWRTDSTGADPDPIKLERLGPGVIKVTQGNLAFQDHTLYHAGVTVTGSGSTTSTTEQVAATVTVTLQPGTYECSLLVINHMSASVAASEGRTYANIAGQSGVPARSRLPAGLDVGVAAAHRRTGVVNTGNIVFESRYNSLAGAVVGFRDPTFFLTIKRES